MKNESLHLVSVWKLKAPRLVQNFGTFLISNDNFGTALSWSCFVCLNFTPSRLSLLLTWVGSFLTKLSQIELGLQGGIKYFTLWEPILSSNNFTRKSSNLGIKYVI